MSSASLFSWPPKPEAVNDVLGAPLNVESVGNFTWLVVAGGILAFMMAWGIGANDVANAFATSVGSGALTLKWACVIAAFCEMGGAVLLGANVTDTVRKKIIDVDVFDPNKGGAANGPELLMTAFFCALISATIWLVMATYLELPVSTTHSIIGSLVGTAFAFRGPDAVVWISDGDGFGKLKGVVGVIASWFISPVLSALFAVTLFIIVRTLVFRTKNPVRNGFIFLPIFYGFTVAIVIFFIIYKGSPRLKLSDKLSLAVCVAIALGAAAAVALLSYFFVVPILKKKVDAWEERELDKAKNPEKYAEEAALAAESRSAKVDGALSKVGVNLNLNEELSEEVQDLHDNVEKFDPKAEQLFTWLQIFTAAFDSFAHGANDVANAVAPFASIYQLRKDNGRITKPKTAEFKSSGTLSGGALDGEAFAKGDALFDGEAFCGSKGDEEYFQCKVTFPNTVAAFPGAKSADFSLYNKDGVFQSETQCFTKCQPGNFTAYSSDKASVELWILALGGVGMVFGLAMWGYKIITAIGQKLTKLTPSRGFSIEIGAAITVIIASRIGLPVSTTHCQVGATMGVGLAEFKANTVNWKQFFFICLGWIFTVLFTALLSAAIYAMFINTPMSYSGDASTIEHCPGDGLFFFDQAKEVFRGVGCSGRD